MDSVDQEGVTLKSLLQNPFLLLPKDQERNELQKPDIPVINKDGDAQKELDKQKEKEKEVELNFDPFGNVDPMNAFLGPKLWDDSMLYGDKDLKFEFMDIDEFLVEQGILEPSKGNKPTAQTKDKDTDNASVEAENDSASSIEVDAANDDAGALPVSPQEVIPMSLLNQTADGASISLTTALPSPPRTPSPVTVDVNFELSHTDVALATIPGEDTYDPRSKVFNEEELKPQPMIKKAKKVFVPDEQKDDKYWARRRKNNVAAKRSREARRIKENQIVLRAAYLEKENGVLKQEVVGLKKENMSLKSVVQKLEKELKNAQDQASLLS